MSSLRVWNAACFQVQWTQRNGDSLDIGQSQCNIPEKECAATRSGARHLGANVQHGQLGDSVQATEYLLVQRHAMESRTVYCLVGVYSNNFSLKLL